MSKPNDTDEADNEYAAVVWRPEDVQTLRPNWTPEQCADWLQANESYIQDRLIELGWDVIDSLLGE